MSNKKLTAADEVNITKQTEIQSYINFVRGDRKSTRLNSSHQIISYAVFCLKKKNCAFPPPKNLLERARAPLRPGAGEPDAVHYPDGQHYSRDDVGDTILGQVNSSLLPPDFS